MGTLKKGCPVMEKCGPLGSPKKWPLWEEGRLQEPKNGWAGYITGVSDVL